MISNISIFSNFSTLPSIKGVDCDSPEGVELYVYSTKGLQIRFPDADLHFSTLADHTMNMIVHNTSSNRSVQASKDVFAATFPFCSSICTSVSSSKKVELPATLAVDYQRLFMYLTKLEDSPFASIISSIWDEFLLGFNLKGHPTLIVGEDHLNSFCHLIKRHVMEASLAGKCAFYKEGISRDLKYEQRMFPISCGAYGKHMYGLEKNIFLSHMVGCGVAIDTFVRLIQKSIRAEDIIEEIDVMIKNFSNTFEEPSFLQEFNEYTKKTPKTSLARQISRHIERSGSGSISLAVRSFASNLNPVEWIEMLQDLGLRLSRKVSLNATESTKIARLFNKAYKLYRDKDYSEKMNWFCTQMVVEKRNKSFADAVLETLPTLPSGLPIVLIVGEDHRKGLGLDLLKNQI